MANFANLRRWAITPAVEEIREKDKLDLKWEAIKAGRKVKMLEFTFPSEEKEKNTGKKSNVPDWVREKEANIQADEKVTVTWADLQELGEKISNLQGQYKKSKDAKEKEEMKEQIDKMKADHLEKHTQLAAREAGRR